MNMTTEVAVEEFYYSSEEEVAEQIAMHTCNFCEEETRSQDIGSVDSTGDLATTILMSNISSFKNEFADVHDECLKNMHYEHSQDKLQASVLDLPSVFQGLQQEFIELTARIHRPPAILTEAHGRLTTSIGLLNSAMIIMYEAYPDQSHRLSIISPILGG